MVRTRPLVVAVSGTSGAGKSTLVAALAARFTGAARLAFDDYVTLGNDVDAIADWLAGGVDPDRIETPRLIDALRLLIAGEAALVLLEEPFGRARTEMAALIDWSVHLDVPLDVALARRLLRSDDVEQRDEQLRAFLNGGRDVYLAIDRVARDAADSILDGLRTTETLVEAIATEIERMTR